MILSMGGTRSLRLEKHSLMEGVGKGAMEDVATEEEEGLLLRISVSFGDETFVCDLWILCNLERICCIK